MDRRSLLKGAALGGVALVVQPLTSLANTAPDITSQLTALERQSGGRLGVALLDTGSGQQIAHRGDERFLMCSTFKLLLVAAVLTRVDRGMEKVDRHVIFDKSVLLDWAPVTGLNVGPPGMTVRELCEAAIIMSDNTATNLLLETIGGTSGFTAYARSIGDSITRLDNPEPLNGKQSGEEDTTTPWSMLHDMKKVLLGDALSTVSRNQLTSWSILNQTGSQTLRAGLPSDWRIGDKTGNGDNTNNDIAIVWPPHRKPLLIAAYYTAENTNTAERKAVLMKVGAIVASLVA